MEGYKQTIRETSKELTAKERVALKHVQATKLDEVVTPEESIVIHPVAYAIMDIHNEVSDNKDYSVYMVEDISGNWYTTGSRSFWDTFIDIWAEMSGEDYDLVVFKMESKNYRGKYFLTCNVQ